MADDKTSKRKVGTSPGVITDREVLAIRWVCEQGLMTVDQFWRAVWWSTNSKGSSYASERILFLERSGFLERVKTPYSLKPYFRATKTGTSLTDRIKESSLIPSFQAPISQIPHVDLLTELRLLIFRADKMESWVTDRVLMVDPSFPKDRFYISVPDAIWVTKKGQRIAIEYERTKKTTAKVRAKIQSYGRELLRPDRLIDVVLWISSPLTYKVLNALLQSSSRQRLRTFDEFKREIENEVNSGSG